MNLFNLKNMQVVGPEKTTANPNVINGSSNCSKDDSITFFEQNGGSLDGWTYLKDENTGADCFYKYNGDGTKEYVRVVEGESDNNQKRYVLIHTSIKLDEDGKGTSDSQTAIYAKKTSR